MSHNIKHYSYKENKKKSEIEAELNDYVRHETWREGGHGLDTPIRFIDRVLPDYESALEFIQNNDKGWYDQLAVKYRQLPYGKTTKKIDDLKARLAATRQEYHALNSVIAAQSFKAEYVGCRHCNSKINRNYIKSNNCPVCHGDMRSDTTLKKLEALKQKIEKISADLKKEEVSLAEKHSEILWLVKIEYHT